MNINAMTQADSDYAINCLSLSLQILYLHLFMEKLKCSRQNMS